MIAWKPAVSMHCVRRRLRRPGGAFRTGFARTAVAASAAAARLALFLAAGFTRGFDGFRHARCGFGFGTRLRLTRRARLLGRFAAAGFARPRPARFGLTRLLRTAFAVARLATAFTAAAALAGLALALAAFARPFAARDGGNRFGCGVWLRPPALPRRAS